MIQVNGEIKDYILMFKNETHNHPTEIEPFGGAATCLAELSETHFLVDRFTKQCVTGAETQQFQYL